MKYNACEKCAKSVGHVNIVGNILMICLKGYMGIIGGSKGLIADAIHSSADLLATIIMIIGMRISSRQKDDKHQYGYGKFEYIVAIIIYLFLVVIASYILFDGVQTIIHRHPIVPSIVAVWGAIFSVVINELMFRQSVCAGNQINSPSMVAKAWESRSDVYSSIAVVIGIIGAKMGFHFMDPLAAIFVGLIIFKISIEMIKEAVCHLMDITPDEIDIPELRQKLQEKLGDIIVCIGNIDVRAVGSEFEFNIHVDVPECITVAEGESLKDEIRCSVQKMLERKSFVKVLLEPFGENTI